MIRKWIPNSLTAAALLVAFASLVACAESRYLLCAQLLMITLILDGLDGMTARLLRTTSTFGAELDTFVDMTAYGLVPAYLVYQIVVPEAGWWGHLLVACTLLSGAGRLSRFRVVDPFRGQKGYRGLPITVNAGWVAMFVFIFQSDLLSDATLSLAHGPLATFVWGCSAAFLFLQVSNVRYGKPTKTPAIFISGIIMITLLFLRVEIAVAAAFALCVYGVYYAFISPFLPRQQTSVDSSEEEEEAVSISHS